MPIRIRTGWNGSLCARRLLVHVSIHKARGAWQEGERPGDSRWCAHVLYCAVGMPPLMAGKKSFRKALKGERKER